MNIFLPSKTNFGDKTKNKASSLGNKLWTLEDFDPNDKEHEINKIV